jgi:hypothetical protein
MARSQPRLRRTHAQHSAAEIEQQISDDYGRALLQHAYDEFTFLSASCPR